MTNTELAALRTDYRMAALGEDDVLSDPLQQLERWLQEAIASQVMEPTAMTLATATAEGQPSARVVLLKGIDAGLVFYTNSTSRKGREMADNPHVAALMFWPELERQVRIVGTVAVVDRTETDAYFASRPRGSRIGAWASPQSTVISSRGVLDAAVEACTARFADADVPAPEFWNGYRITPTSVEFWQGRSSRLHDRILMRRVDEGWLRERLAP